MRCSETVHPIDLLIHDLKSSVRQTLQRLTDEVQAVPHVALLYIYRKLFVYNLDTVDCSMVASPVTTAKSVHAVKLMEHGEG